MKKQWAFDVKNNYDYLQKQNRCMRRDMFVSLEWTTFLEIFIIIKSYIIDEYAYKVIL